MERNVLIGGAWPYANNSLHVGHLAALLPADIIARYYRKNGDNVMYVSGTDSHGTPITVRAKKEGISPQEIADFYHKEFTKNFSDLDFSYDLYTTTATEYHNKKVQEYFLEIKKNGYIYEKEEVEDFCDVCNNFLSDRELIGTCPHCGGSAKGDQCDACTMALNANELLDKHCKECGSATTQKLNKHLYFKLSAFQDVIRELVNKNKTTWRKNAVNETVKYLDMGLIDRAATRQLDWGVPVPVVGYEDKVIYVWIEAVMGYITATNKVCDDKGLSFDSFMKESDNLITYFVHGKDNIPFHSVIYPALLKAMDTNNQLPNYIISSEYINMNDEKMSKSVGNLISVNELLSKYNKDSIRYYMMINNPEKRDFNFSSTDLEQTHNKFLVGVLGNFINRNFSFITKKFDGLITNGEIDSEIKLKTIELYKTVGRDIEQGELKTALESIMDYVTLGNRYYDTKAPWLQVKDDINEFNKTTYTCTYMVANIANLLSPFLPSTTAKINNMINVVETGWNEVLLDGNIKLNDIAILFDRIEDK